MLYTGETGVQTNYCNAITLKVGAIAKFTQYERIQNYVLNKDEKLF